MSIKRIAVFAPLVNQYGVVDFFTQELTQALIRQGIETTIIKADRDNPRAFLNQILADKPDCTLSFNGLLPDNDGHFLCDVIKVPHIALLTDAPNHYFSLANSSHTVIACIDQDFCDTFKNMNVSRVLFLPHAASKNLEPLLEPDYQYDILMLNSYIDYQAVGQSWEGKYGLALKSVLEEAAEWTLSDRDIPYMHAFIQTMDRHLKMGKAIDPSKLDYEDILDSLESYLGGKSRIELLQAIEGASIHIFGAQPGTKDWEKDLKNCKSHIHIHETVPFAKALQLMQRAKIVLHVTPEIKRGLHERILSGLGCGAAVLALDTPFLHETFQDEEDLLFYGPRDWKEVNRKIQLYLHDESTRQQLAKKGREKVMRQHTWDQRAKALIQQLPPILGSI